MSAVRFCLEPPFLNIESTMKKNLLIPQGLKNIVDIIESNGFEAFIVGGCVRDSLLGLKPKDWDITTNATPTQVRDIFKKHKKFSVIDIGEEHGTLGLFEHKTRMLFEITTYRLDGKYNDFRRPSSISFGHSLKADLSRRDFTINALACKIL